MLKRSALDGNSSAIGDLKQVSATATFPADAAVNAVNGQEWLRTGYLTPYQAKYAVHAEQPVGRRLYAYDTTNEQAMSVAVAANYYAQLTVEYHAGRYYFFPDSGAYQVKTKAVLDGGATAGTASSALPGGVNITEVRASHLVKAGTGAGRFFVGTDGVDGYKLMYQTGTMQGAWVDAGFGSSTGGNPRVMMGKPDGSLLVVLMDNIGAGYGAGCIKTSANGGTAWVAQSASNASNINVCEGQWCPSLGKFVLHGYLPASGAWGYFTSANGYTWAQEAGVTLTNSGGRASSVIADNGVAAFVIGAGGSGLYRSVGGAAFALIALPRALVAICAAGATLYGQSNGGGIEVSTDNGDTWTPIGQLNGAGAGFLTGSSVPVMKVANGHLFFSSGANLARFSTQPLPGLTPDKVGATHAATISGQSYWVNYVRIL